MAAPHVAGAVGLVYSQNPGWTYQQVRTQIISTARPITSLAGRTVSGGVLDAAAALGVFVPPPPPPPAPPAAPGTPTLTIIGGGQILVAWADNSANEDGFQVQREKKSGNRWIQTTLVADVPADTTSVNDAPGAGTFRYRVLAYNSLGASSWSAWRQINN
jgi:serine protease